MKNSKNYIKKVLENQTIADCIIEDIEKIEKENLELKKELHKVNYENGELKTSSEVGEALKYMFNFSISEEASVECEKYLSPPTLFFWEKTSVGSIKKSFMSIEKLLKWYMKEKEK